MKGIFFLLFFILITFSNESFFIRCPPGQAKVCGCTQCRCVTKPKCPPGQYAKCESTFVYSGCYCTTNKSNLRFNITKNTLKKY